MREELFQELLLSMRQGGAILRGEMEPARIFVIENGKGQRLKKSTTLKSSSPKPQPNPKRMLQKKSDQKREP